MKYKVNDKLELEILDYKPYKVTKMVKLALLQGVNVKEWETPEIPAENAIASEEALIYWMTNITKDQLNALTDEEYSKLLEKINEIAIMPRWSSIK